MSIDKKAFDKAIQDVQDNPRDYICKEKAGDMLCQMAAMIAHHHKFEYTPDHIQEVVLKAWKGLEKIDQNKGSAFNYLWTYMKRDFFKEFEKDSKYRKRFYLFSSLQYEPDPASEKNTEEDFMLKRLDIDLDKFKEKVLAEDVTLPNGVGKKLKSNFRNNLTLSNGKKVPNYVFKALVHLQNSATATLSELVELYGFHRGDQRKTMEFGIRSAAEANDLDVEITIKKGEIIFKAENLNLGDE